MYENFYRRPPVYARTVRAVRELRGHKALRVFPIGESVMGRKIFAFVLGSPREATLLVGGVHGMEWLTTLMLFRLLEDLINAIESGNTLADIDIGKSMEDRSVVIIPCLNPDGVEISVSGSQSAGALAPFIESVCGGETNCWQANARGVDLNHNFEAGFSKLKELEKAAGITGPSPTRYGGIFPHSEPESRALVCFCEKYTPRQAYAFHSQGEEIYYRYGYYTPARSQLMAQVLASSSGYHLASPERLASHGGFKDWFIKYMRRPGFTVEIGRGKNPLPIEELEPIYARLLEMLLIAMLL